MVTDVTCSCRGLKASDVTATIVIFVALVAVSLECKMCDMSWMMVNSFLLCLVID